MLTIETIDGLTSVRNPATNDVWIFAYAAEALVFIKAWFSDDVRGIIYYAN